MSKPKIKTFSLSEEMEGYSVHLTGGKIFNLSRKMSVDHHYVVGYKCSIEGPGNVAVLYLHVVGEDGKKINILSRASGQKAENEEEIFDLISEVKIPKGNEISASVCLDGGEWADVSLHVLICRVPLKEKA